MASCSICQEQFGSADTNIVIVKHQSDKSLDQSRTRGHYFHRNCLNTWAEYSGKRVCPLDREQVRSVYQVPPYLICGLNLSQHSNFYELYATMNINARVVNSINRESTNHRDKAGRTLFYCACQRNDLKLAKALVKLGADCTIANSQGFTPLMVSVSNKQYDLCSWLLRQSAILDTIHAVDHMGLSALEIALLNKHANMVALLLDTKRFSQFQLANLHIKHKKALAADFYGRQILDMFHRRI